MWPYRIGYVVSVLVLIASIIFLGDYLWPRVLPFWTELIYQWQSPHVVIPLSERIRGFLIEMALTALPGGFLGGLAGLAAKKIAEVCMRRRGGTGR